MPEDCEGRYAAVALGAILDAAARVEALTVTLATQCQTLAVALGGSPDEHPSTTSLEDAEAWCDAAVARLASVEGTITKWLPLCLYEIAPLAECEASCSGVEACEAGATERCSLATGSCAGECTGLCYGTTGPAECEGMCLGGCTGTCGGQPIDGGACFAGCSGTCVGACELAAHCSQLCVGSCDVDLEDGRCGGRPLAATQPCDVCGECAEACAWRSNLAARCAPAPVVVELVPDDPVLADTLRTALSDAHTTTAEIDLVLAPEVLWFPTLFVRSFEDPTTKTCVDRAEPSVTALSADVERLTQLADSLAAATAAP